MVVAKTFQGRNQGKSTSAHDWLLKRCKRLYRMTRFSSAFHSHACQISRRCNSTLTNTVTRLYVFISIARIAHLFPCLKVPENTGYSSAEFCFGRIFCISCCHIWYQNGGFRDRDWFRNSRHSTPNIHFFTRYEIKHVLLANTLAGHSTFFSLRPWKVITRKRSYVCIKI